QLQFADAVISVSSTLTKRLIAKSIHAKVHDIANALDEPEPQWSRPVSPTQRRYILAVGRVTSQKNIDTLLRAFACFSESQPGHQLLVAGSLSDKRYVATLSSLLTPGVTMLGAVPRQKIPTLLSQCALYVNLSHHEGNSNATLEAISHGCPLLVSDIAENHEIPLEPHNFVDQTNIRAVASAFAMVFAKPEMFVVRRSGFLSWEQVAAKTQDVYRSIL
nr:glycosyltransferase family 4 protein [Pseudomonas sp.]